MIGKTAPQRPPTSDALRERAASALERALDFVKREGDALATLRAHVALEATPTAEALAVLADRQNAEGSFAPLGDVFDRETEARLCASTIPAEILGSLEALSLLADWRLLYDPCAERVIEFLRATQHEDGGWGEPADAEGDSVERIFTAAMIAGFAGRTRCARPGMIVPARDYVASHWSVERLRREGWLLVAGYAHFYSTVSDEDREVALPWCGRELERGYQAGEYGAGATMRVLLYCDASALPGTDFEVQELLARLLDEVDERGGHAGGVGPTLDTMLGILRLCRVDF